MRAWNYIQIFIFVRIKQEIYIFFEFISITSNLIWFLACELLWCYSLRQCIVTFVIWMFIAYKELFIVNLTQVEGFLYFRLFKLLNGAHFTWWWIWSFNLLWFSWIILAFNIITSAWRLLGIEVFLRLCGERVLNELQRRLAFLEKYARRCNGLFIEGKKTYILVIYAWLFSSGITAHGTFLFSYLLQRITI